ncbi:MAG TPA: radical SAM protein [Dehalococcoidia bacterium]|nr:radical SAM protein [Dehalococcoidia bacterium]
MSSYIKLHKTGELRVRAERLEARLAHCDICPRACGVNRLKGEQGFCRSGDAATISACCEHKGEEPVLSGTRGSGTIFFTGCNLRCVFCQNYQISQEFENTRTERLDCRQLAEKMLYLQDDLKCHNINFVSPTQYAPQIVRAIDEAAGMGLHIPLIYNTNGYDSIDTLKELDGVIDIYLPDIKYASDSNAVNYSHVDNYVEISREAIREMHRQVGDLVIDSDGIALRGLIVRHLVLPNNISGARDCISWLICEVSPAVTMSIMSQYYPCFKAPGIPELARKLSSDEYYYVTEWLDTIDAVNGWVQEFDSPEVFLPDFNGEGHPFVR